MPHPEIIFCEGRRPETKVRTDFPFMKRAVSNSSLSPWLLEKSGGRDQHSIHATQKEEASSSPCLLLGEVSHFLLSPPYTFNIHDNSRALSDKGKVHNSPRSEILTQILCSETMKQWIIHPQFFFLIKHNNIKGHPISYSNSE